jgi:hypothetical protein
MITPTEIIQKAQRRYLSCLQSWLRDEAFSPYEIPVGAPPTEFVALRSAVEALHRSAREQRGYGYSIRSEFRRTRQHGDQHLPVRVVIETQEDLLRLIGKEEEFGCFQADVVLIRERLPALNPWMERFPQRVIDSHGDWLDLLEVCLYFLEHPRPGLFMRELPIPIHTKFIEQHRGLLQDLLRFLLPASALDENATTFEQRFGLREEEPLVRVRLLDQQFARRYGLPIDDLTLPCSQFAALDLQGQCCIITENKQTFLTVPALSEAFALFGGGFMVQNLAAIPWLKTCPLLYWGDLDAHGFQILALLRATFPHVVSVMMDRATLSAFANFHVVSTPFATRELPLLTAEEQVLFREVAEKTIRLEQEHITHAYALDRLHTAREALLH